MADRGASRTTMRLTVSGADSMLIDSVAFSLGTTRTELILGAVRQFIIRQYLGISDPTEPVGKVSKGRRVVSPPPEAFKAALDKSLVPKTAVEYLLQELARHGIDPVRRIGYMKPRRPFDPRDPESYNAAGYKKTTK